MVWPGFQCARSPLHELEAGGVKVMVNALSDGSETGRNSVELADGSIVEGTADLDSGKAKPSTSSDGNGYDLARSFGHTITPALPALSVKLAGSFHQIQGVKLVRRWRCWTGR